MCHGRCPLFNHIVIRIESSHAVFTFVGSIIPVTAVNKRIIRTDLTTPFLLPFFGSFKAGTVYKPECAGLCTTYAFKSIYRIIQPVDAGHFHFFGDVLPRKVSGVGYIDSFLFCTFFAGNQYDTESSFSSINRSGSGIFQNRNGFDIIRIYHLDRRYFYVIQ